MGRVALLPHLPHPICNFDANMNWAIQATIHGKSIENNFVFKAVPRIGTMPKMDLSIQY